MILTFELALLLVQRVAVTVNGVPEVLLLKPTRIKAAAYKLTVRESSASTTVEYEFRKLNTLIHKKLEGRDASFYRLGQ